jgi:hypothetical protein
VSNGAFDVPASPVALLLTYQTHPAVSIVTTPMSPPPSPSLRL